MGGGRAAAVVVVIVIERLTILPLLPHSWTDSMLCGYLPFSSESQADMFQLIQNARYAFHDEDWSAVSPEAKDFIAKLLVVDPSQRMRAKEAVEHPWLVKYAAEEAPHEMQTLAPTIKKNATRSGGIATLRRLNMQAKGGLVAIG